MIVTKVESGGAIIVVEWFAYVEDPKPLAQCRYDDALGAGEEIGVIEAPDSWVPADRLPVRLSEARLVRRRRNRISIAGRSICPRYREFGGFDQRRFHSAGGEGGESVDSPPRILRGAVECVGQRAARAD